MTTSQTTNSEQLARTPLHDLHIELGARLVPFAGYEMPVQYPSGILKEHLHARDAAVLFDVSHMGQVHLSGPDAARALETLVPVDIVDLPAGRQRYALFTNETGGVLDDLMVTNTGEDLLLVVNAACKDQDIAHLRTHIGERCHIEHVSDRALLAIQGPGAAAVMARIAPASADLLFMRAAPLAVDGVECYVSRSGYTGEDGFEISVPGEQAESVARALLRDAALAPAGLGARDSLRLEAGLCLYGHELAPGITPVEADLGWALSRVRRTDGARAGGYPGAATIAEQLACGAPRRRVGIRPDGKAPIRDGTELVDASGESLGTVTSGGYGPSVGGPVAMGYVAAAQCSPGTSMQALVRGRPRPAALVKLPFVAPRYFRG